MLSLVHFTKAALSNHANLFEKSVVSILFEILAELVVIS